MRKALLIGLIVCVLAVSGIGAAFAAGLNFTNVGMLARGGTTVPAINVDQMGYVISSGVNEPAAVVGVTLSFDALVPANSVIFISVRGTSGELAYYAADNNAAIGKGAVTPFYLYGVPGNVQYVPGAQPAIGLFPDVSAVTNIVVTVAGNSSYNTP